MFVRRWMCSTVVSLSLATVCHARGEEEAKTPSPKGKTAAAAVTGTRDGNDAGKPLAPGVLARVNGRQVTVREYADYLLSSLGTSKLQEFIDRLLIVEEARKLAVEVTPEETEKLVSARIEREIQGLFLGDETRFLASLTAQGITLEERKNRLRQRLYYEQTLEGIVLKGRSVSEDDIKQEFTRLHGPGGVRHHVRHVLVSTRARTGAGGERLPRRSEDGARKRAEKILSEIRGGAPFAAQVRKYSDDTLTRRNDGLIDRYHEKLYGPEFHKSVVGLSEGSPVSVVRSPRGFHVIQLVRKEATLLDDVRQELTEQLRNRPASRQEKNTTIARLRQAAKIVR